MKVTFRIDDITTHMDWDKFDRLADIFSRYGVKPLLGVIPDNRDPHLLKLPYREDGWARIKALYDRGWPVAQHGFNHVYTTTESGLLGINDRSEFAGVDYETQLKMLSEGRRLLEERGLETDIFMAPAHSYDRDTLKALRALGFRYVTDGYSLCPYRRYGLKFVPCQTAAPRKIPFGLQTVCLHANTMREDTFGSIEDWLRRNRRRVCDYSEALRMKSPCFVSVAVEKLVLGARKVKKTAASGGAVTEALKTDTAKNIVLFTSNYQGGVFQFTLYLAEVIARQGLAVHAFIPNSASGRIPDDGLLTVCRYARFRKFLPKNKFAGALSRRIAACAPERVVFCDDSIISQQVIIQLGKKLPVTLFVHDISPHPSWFDLREKLRILLLERYRCPVFKRSNQILMLSKNGYEQFKAAYPKVGDKADYMMLGAHVPDAEPAPPAELSQPALSGYYLFFGRIDRYKGIISLLKAYETLGAGDRRRLVIAGSGVLQDDEKALIARNDGVLLINRFISDSEMLWLIQNALTVVLPYTEASQSGVLPLAYHFGVPVVTSNVPGLTEFVEDGGTGLICTGIRELADALIKMTDPVLREKLGRGALEFSKERLDWDVNVRKSFKLADLP